MTKTPDTTPQPNYPDQIIGNNQQPGAEHAVNAAPFAADLRGIEQAAPQHVATVWVDDEGCNDFELSPFFSLPAGEYKLYTGAAPAAPVAENNPEFPDGCAVPASPAQQDAPTAQPARECLQQSAERLHAAATNAYALLSSGMAVPDAQYRIVTELAAALQAAPPAPEAVAVPGERAGFENWYVGFGSPQFGNMKKAMQAAWKARAALAATPAQANRYCGAGMCVPSDKQHAPGRDAAPAQAVAVPDSVIAGALFDFCGYLTTMPKDHAITVSGSHEASPIVEALKTWAEKRGLHLDEADVSGWHAAPANGSE